VVEVRSLRPGETSEAVGVLARGMRDNPIHVAAFGPDPARRLRSLERMFGALFRVFGGQRPICAVDGQALVAVAGVAPHGTCQPTMGQRLRFAPAMARLGPGAARRVGTWLAAWGARDPGFPHSHLGPLAVDAPLQGRGIGSEVMTAYCAGLDAAGEVGYLETDRAGNVRFYERHGYVVTGEEDVLGVPNWFMVRQPVR
jgi:ribosomal protein S18 acetylase RimI-like enzyme